MHIETMHVCSYLPPIRVRARSLQLVREAHPMSYANVVDSAIKRGGNGVSSSFLFTFSLPVVEVVDEAASAAYKAYDDARAAN